MSLILTNLKHFTVTFLLLLVTLVCFGLFIGADAHLFEDVTHRDRDLCVGLGGSCHGAKHTYRSPCFRRGT